MKKITKLMLSMLLISATSSALVIDAKTTEVKATVNIPDDKLKVCINEELGNKPDDSITETQLAGITNLDCKFAGITNLEGLEKATKLKTLDLQYMNYVSDLSPLSGLTNLKYLFLRSDEKLSDLSPLSGSNLESLAVSGTSVKDLSALSSVTSLKYLDIGENDISDLNILKPLSSLPNFEKLDMDKNKITDISSLSEFTKNLTELSVYDNSISDISSLSKLKKLEEIQLGKNNISDLSPLSGLANLSVLQANKNNISDLSPLSGLSKLFDLKTQDQTINLDFGTVTNLNDLPKEYKIKIIEKDGKENEVIIPLDNVTVGDNNYSKDYSFDGNQISGKVNLKFTYINVPVIEGMDNIEIVVGEEFDPMQGVRAIDTEDGDITSKVKYFTNEAREDNLSVGIHVYKYFVEDSDGNKTEATREVTVLDDGSKPSKPGSDGSDVSKPGSDGSITPMHPTDNAGDEDKKLTKTGSNMPLLSVVAISSLYLIKKKVIKLK